MLRVGVALRIYQSHAATSFASLRAEEFVSEILKFTNEKSSWELREPRYRDRESFPSPTTRYRFAGGI